MKLFAILVFGRVSDSECIELAAAKELTDFGYFQRSSVGEFMSFFSKTVAERTPAGSRQSVEEQAYVCHVHARSDNLVGLVITDKEYNQRVAFSLIMKVVDEFQSLYPTSKTWSRVPGSMPFPSLEPTLAKYQNPQEADAMARIQKDLDETKIILHKNMASVLERGDKLEDLVAKSDQLSATSKMFYKQAQKTNSCCTMF